MWLTNIGRYQLDGERNGRHSFGISDHEVQVVKIMLNSVWGNFQGGQGRSVLETAKWEEICCFPYQFARPDYPNTRPWSS